MKNLDSINPSFAKPSNICSIGAIIPFTLCLISIALIYEAAGNIPLFTNGVAIFFMIAATATFFLFFIPKFFRWDWNAKYFLATPLMLGSMVLFGGIPWLCFLLYSTFSIQIRIFAFSGYVSILFFRGKRFFKIYKDIEKTPYIREIIYQAEDDAVYFIQRNDSAILKNKYNISVYPKNLIFIISITLGLIFLPFHSYVTSAIGLPFIHIFLGISAIPIDIMAISFAVRGWMSLNRLPKYIKSTTGKDVFVDMTSKNEI